MKKFGIATFAMTAILPWLTACGGGEDGPTNAPQVALKAREWISSTKADRTSDVSEAASASVIRYRMSAVSGDLTEANAVLFIPKGSAPSGGWPLVVWAHGTTGVADGCAPSSDFNGFGDSVVVNPLVKAGFAVLAPDYEGLGGPGVHPFYSRTSHAYSVIDAVRAVRAMPQSPVSPRVAILGHSQGGHVAIAANELSARGAGSFELRAVVALAPGGDTALSSDLLFALIDKLVAEKRFEEAAIVTTRMNYYGTMIAYGFQAQQASFDPSSVFGDRVKPLLSKVLTDSDCTKYGSALNADIDAYVKAGGAIGSYAGVRRDWYRLPGVSELLARNRNGQVAAPVPTLIIQGDADFDVPIAATQSLYNNMRTAGSVVSLSIVPDGDHSSIIEPALPEIVTYFRQRLAP